MTLWYATQGTVSIGDAMSSVSTTTDLKSDFDANANGADFSADLKEVTFGGGAAGVDVLNVFSTQLKEEKRPELRTVDFTLVASDIDALEWIFGTATYVTGSYYRVNGSDKTGNRENKSILFTLTNGTNTVNVLMNNAYFTTTGEISLAADGTAELTMSAVCLVKDFYAEDDI